ncbi:MAG: DIP1984 family protein [Oscillospiraceae bacterium]|nr:DIP1984 family protein [Oscillospiraceae bacterium]
MKLAEALNKRADIAKRIAQLGVRLNNNSKVSEGDKPAEDPMELLKELELLTEQLEDLIAKINCTNSMLTHNGSTLTQLLARKDALTLRASIIRQFLDNASSTVQRYSRSEIKLVSTVDVAALRRNSDSISEEIRNLNLTIQELNWTNDLIE